MREDCYIVNVGTKFKGIKTAAEYQRGELAKDVLRLVGAGIIMGAAVMAPGIGQVVDCFNPKSAAERKRIWNAIHYLEQKGHIRIEERGANRFMWLTRQGKTKLDEEAIWELTVNAPYRWDRKWRMVMFDIPRGHESARQAFRLKLADLGFVMYQRSVFIHPYECQREVNTIAKWYGIHRHIRYVVATEINDMRHFVNKFDLP